MSNAEISVGIIGCGNMGKVHAKELKQAGARVYGLADPRLDVAEALKQEVGAERVVADGRALIDDPNVDAVVIATHHDLHVPQALAAAQAGKHIFIEKPLALTVAECEQVVAAVESAGVKAMCGFQARFSPFCRTLRELVGKPLVLLATFTDPKWGPTSWANDPKAGGGNVLSQGCHMFDMMCYFAQGEPAVIHAEGGNFQHPELPITDSVVATIRFANGVVASAVVGDYGFNPTLGKAAYHLYAGSKVGALVRYYNEPELQFWGLKPPRITGADLSPAHLAQAPSTDWRSPARLWLHGYPQQIEAFLKWLANGERPLDACGIREAARATRMAVRCIESIQRGETVRY